MKKKQNDNILKKVEITNGKILFVDMDGTLINTDNANFLSYKKAVEKVLSINIDDLFNQKIRFNRKVLKTIFSTISDEDFNEIIKLKNKYYSGFLSTTKLNYSLFELLTEYKKTNKIILVTSCRKKRALSILKHHRIIEIFDNFYFYDELFEYKTTNKYEFAITDLKISPTNVIVFEDEQTEIDKAIYAGIPQTNIVNCINN